MNTNNSYIYLLITAAILISCGSTDSGGNGDDDGPQQFNLSTSVEPSGSGTVSPSSGTFDDGASVTVEATANNGWEFLEWTGDINSQDNPLNFSISQNTSLTANFNSVSSIYNSSVTFADSLNSMELRFGQNESATSGFDSNQDFYAPPDPPPGALNAYFKHPNDRFLYDYREFDADSLTWNIQYTVGDGDSLSLSWNLSLTRLTGTLELRNGDGSISVDMSSQQSLAFPVTAADSLLIKYKLQN